MCHQLSGTRGKGLCVSRLGPETAAGGPAPSLTPGPSRAWTASGPGPRAGPPAPILLSVGPGQPQALDARRLAPGRVTAGGTQGRRTGGNRSRGRRAQAAGRCCAGGPYMTCPQGRSAPQTGGPARGTRPAGGAGVEAAWLGTHAPAPGWPYTEHI